MKRFFSLCLALALVLTVCPVLTDADAAAAPTCTQPGLTAGNHCSVCGGVLTAQTVVPAAGHNYQVTNHVESTEQSPGSVTYTCSVCADQQPVRDYAREAMNWAVRAGLINGIRDTATGVTALSPKSTATRAQIAAVIMRFAGMKA